MSTAGVPVHSQSYLVRFCCRDVRRDVFNGPTWQDIGGFPPFLCFFQPLPLWHFRNGYLVFVPIPPCLCPPCRTGWELAACEDSPPDLQKATLLLGPPVVGREGRCPLWGSPLIPFHWGRASGIRMWGTQPSTTPAWATVSLWGLWEHHKASQTLRLPFHKTGTIPTTCRCGHVICEPRVVRPARRARCRVPQGPASSDSRLSPHYPQPHASGFSQRHSRPGSRAHPSCLGRSTGSFDTTLQGLV